MERLISWSKHCWYE